MTRKPRSFPLEPAPAKKSARAGTTATAGTTARARKPRAVKTPAAHIRFTEQSPCAPVPATVETPPATAPKRRWRWAGVALSAAFGLFCLWLSTTLIDLVRGFFARAEWLGWTGLGLIAVIALAVLMACVREIAGLMRLSRLTHLRRAARAALAERDATAAAEVTGRITALYAGRDDLRWGLQRMREHADDIIDPPDRLRLIERDVLAVLDREAGRLIAFAARRVAVLTAVTPAAGLDMALVAWQNLKLLRQLARLYGGRPGTLSTLRLARMVIAHLVVAGGLALTDGLVQQLIGRGLMGRLSSRFGEGAVNGILTARIALAALDVIRPVPFVDRSPPKLADFLKDIVSTGPAR